MKEEKLKSVFDPEDMEESNEEDTLSGAALRISDETKEYLNTSSFVIARDSIKTKSPVFLIEEDLQDSEDVQRDFLELEA